MPTWHSWMSGASFSLTTTFATMMADHENSNSITEKRGTSQLRIRGLIVRGDIEYSLADFVCKVWWDAPQQINKNQQRTSLLLRSTTTTINCRIFFENFAYLANKNVCKFSLWMDIFLQTLQIVFSVKYPCKFWLQTLFANF